ncbi:hypothetical protein LRAMOSA02986 [Lichtheimia ramosa]|uniref:DNA helicase n=1 Tax=Lichtheimia ramosa TaxID=688394 RepID=A0A077WSH1_9FUNG|nr:hypothetical protein LRAMOSA02986 [Lichtheimia ramosa]
MLPPGWTPDASPTTTSRPKMQVKDILKSHAGHATFAPATRVADRQARSAPFSLSDRPSLSRTPSSPMKTEDSDDDEDEERISRRHTMNRKRRKAVFDSDDDMEESAYVDEQEQRQQQESATLAKRARDLQSIFPNKNLNVILDALRQSNGSKVKASTILSGMIRTTSSPSASPEPERPRKRLKQRGPAPSIPPLSDEEDNDDDEEQEEQDSDSDVDYRKVKDPEEEARKMHQTVRFYNRASAQEIQDVSGCTEEQAQKIIDLRPFGSIDDLRDTLHQEKGLSIRFIQNYVDMVDGYSIVDQIIGEIEELGASLKDIIDVWKGSSINNDDSNDAGVHLATVNTNAKKQQQQQLSSQLYKDAMEGFLTEQPALINKDMKLKDYQLLGVNWLLLLYRKKISGILADEMGLGKTAQVISFLSRIYELGDPGPHLIIVPTSTLENWMREFERFCPELKVYSYYGSQEERMMLRHDWRNNFDGQVIVSTYNVATGNNDDRKFLRKMMPRSVILDEGHMVRNCTSKRYQQLMTIEAPFRLLLTGTPLQNNLQELVSLLTFILPDMLLEYEEEVSKIFKIKAASNKDSTAQILSQQRIARAKKMMTPFVLRRRKTDVLKDLPQKFQVIERCKMTQTQQELYDTILHTSRQSYQQAIVSDKKKKGAFDQFKNMVMHLRKAANHPMLFRNIYDDAKLKIMAKDIMKEEQYWDANEDYIYEDMTVMTDFELDKLCRNHKSIKQYALKNKEWMNAGKVDKLKHLLPAMKEEGRKVLIFSQFTQLLDILERVMDTLQLRFLRLDGATKMEDRQVLIDQFNEDQEITVFLLSTKAGGMGINLTAANVVVLYDMDFNPQNDRQAEDRAHRVGQTQDVTVYKFVTDQSVEENILSMAEIKLRLDRSVSGVGEDQVEENDQDQKETVHSLLKAVLLS